MSLPPALPSNLIRKGKVTSIANPNHPMSNLLCSHLAALGHNIISYLHHIPDDRCVRHLSGMLLIYNLLHVCWPGRRSFIRWENTRVRDFGIPSHVARLMMSCSLTPMYPIRVVPQTRVYYQSRQHLLRHLRVCWRMSGDVMYKGKLPLNPLR